MFFDIKLTVLPKSAPHMLPFLLNSVETDLDLFIMGLAVGNLVLSRLHPCFYTSVNRYEF